MTNFNEKITTATTKTDIQNIVNEFNENVLNNVENVLDFSALSKKVDKLNENTKNDFINQTVENIINDRKKAFEKLVYYPNFEKCSLSVEDNGKLKFADDGKALFKFAELEKAFQLRHATETDKNGKKIRNKSVTIFGALRFYGLCECFIRHLFNDNVSLNGEIKIDLSKIKIADKTIFSENDGKCFSSNSNNALEKQLNILAKFFDIEVKMLKRDLPALKIVAQKVRRNVTNNRSSIQETNTLNFVDFLFSVITSRYLNENVALFDSSKNEIKYIIEDDKTTEENTAE